MFVMEMVRKQRFVCNGSYRPKFGMEKVRIGLYLYAKGSKWIKLVCNRFVLRMLKFVKEKDRNGKSLYAMVRTGKSSYSKEFVKAKASNGKC